MDRFEKVAIQARGFQRAFGELFQKVGIVTTFVPPGLQLDNAQETATLFYSLLFGAKGHKPQRKAVVPYHVIEDSDTWFEYMKSTILLDFNYIVQYVIDDAKRVRPTFTLHN